jgi:hypothetical protein
MNEWMNEWMIKFYSCLLLIVIRTNILLLIIFPIVLRGTIYYCIIVLL